MSTPPLLPPQTSSNFIKQSRKKVCMIWWNKFGINDLATLFKSGLGDFGSLWFVWHTLLHPVFFCDFGLNNLKVICRGVIVFLGHYFLSAWMLRLPMKMFFLGSLIDQHFNGFFFHWRRGFSVWICEGPCAVKSLLALSFSMFCLWWSGGREFYWP